MIKDKRYLTTLIIIIGITLYIQFLPDKIQAKANNSFTFFTKLKKIIEIINYAYVDSVDINDIMDGAFYGMMSKLDPHSSYIPPEKQKEVEEDFDGEFGGIGIEFEIKVKYLTVITAIPDTPSDEIGLLPGDKIIKINGKTSYDITTAEVFKRLKGPINDPVTITVMRNNINEYLEYTIKRKPIPIYSVTEKCLLDDKITGLIKINRFARKTGKEFLDALTELRNDGMKRLILDLRGNPGGLLDQAVEVVDNFLEENKLIVYTKGRLPQFYEEYYSTKNYIGANFPLIIIIDTGSASASEIVTGALQDYDKAYIIGTQSFGKGLVQRPFNFKDGSVTRITIAKYYTPTGRCIQRPYNNGVADYYLDLYETEENLSETKKAQRDSIKQSNKYLTINQKRTVYGGGGITPDSVIYYKRTPRIIQELYRKNIFREFSIEFYNKNKKNISSDFEDFYQNFNPSAHLKHFKQFCFANKFLILTPSEYQDYKRILKNEQTSLVITKNKFKLELTSSNYKDYIIYEEKTFNKNISIIKSDLKYIIAKQFFKSKKQYPRIKAMTDIHILKALELFPKINNLITKGDQ